MCTGLHEPEVSVRIGRVMGCTSLGRGRLTARQTIRTPPVAVSRQRLRSALPLALLVCACACVARVEPRAPHPAVAETITVSLHFALRWPFRPERALIVLDGVPIQDGVPVPSIDPLHTVRIVADISVPCGPLASPRTSSRVVAVKTVLATSSAVVDFYVFDRGDPTVPPMSRIDARWVLRGARVWPSEFSEPVPSRMVASN